MAGLCGKPINLTISFWLLLALGSWQCKVAYGFSVPLQRATHHKPLAFGFRRSSPRARMEWHLAADSKKDNTETSVKRQSSLRLPLKVGGVYGALGLTVVKCVRKKWLAPKEALAGCGLLWLGFVLAISLTEAWVKFRAPFLPKYYGLDVGRTVFPVLNSVEVAFCSTMWLIQVCSTTMPGSSVALLACATLILLSQVLVLTPQLVLLGKHVIADAFTIADSSWSTRQRQIYDDLCAEVKVKARPSSKLHIVYVQQEFIKVVLLGKLVWSCRSLVLA